MIEGDGEGLAGHGSCAGVKLDVPGFDVVWFDDCGLRVCDVLEDSECNDGDNIHSYK